MPRNHKSKKPIKPMKLDISDEMIAERRGGSGPMPKSMPKWMASTIIKIDLFSKWIGNVVCWITVPLIFAMTYEVLARKLFTAPTMWAYDMSRFFYGALFMLGAGYALSKGVHIRADFLYRNFKVKTQGLIDFWLYLLFYFPGLLALKKIYSYRKPTLLELKITFLLKLHKPLQTLTALKSSRQHYQSIYSTCRCL